MAETRPDKVSPGKAASVACTVCPGLSGPAIASGTAALSQTVPRPLTSASVWPAVMVLPARTFHVLLTPRVGDESVMTLCGRPARSTGAIVPEDMRRRSEGRGGGQAGG